MWHFLALKLHNNSLQFQLQRVTFGAALIQNDDQKTCFYTGLATYQLFKSLFAQLEPLLKQPISKLSLIDEFFVTLVKLRLGVPHSDLAYRMGTNEKTIGCVFRHWIDVMSVELRCLISWPDKETLMHNLPISFKSHFSNVRCIIDCFEVFIQRPTSFVARAQTYSNYKKHNTVKVLIGVAPTGTICFISEA